MTGEGKLTIERWLEKYSARKIIEVLYEDGVEIALNEFGCDEGCFIHDIEDQEIDEFIASRGPPCWKLMLAEAKRRELNIPLNADDMEFACQLGIVAVVDPHALKGNKNG